MPRRKPTIALSGSLAAVTGNPGRPRKLTHALIVAAATQVLEEEGFGALSMRSLAQRLGVNHATLYNYVGHIEDVETEVLESLMARVPIPSADRVETMRAQLIKHLLAVRDLQLQHPHVLYAPVGSPTWRSHMRVSNRVLRALEPHGRSLVEVALAYNTLTAMMASSAERARSTGTTDYIAAQRKAILAIATSESEQVRRMLAVPGASGPSLDSLSEVLDYLIDRVLPDIDRARKTRKRK